MQDVRRGAFEVSETAEQRLKNIALVFGLLSVAAVVFDFYPYTMFFSLPFCAIWIFCAWLRSEPQLKWINIVFFCLYVFGISRYFGLV
ncbi:peptidase [Alphaproteobacteria bacterium US3C007]|nr:peptidase [Alphaproteobacteria bacterium US3C007]